LHSIMYPNSSNIHADCDRDTVREYVSTEYDPI
jgi:hypothetical protein